MTKDLHELVKRRISLMESWVHNDLHKSLLEGTDKELQHHELGYQEGVEDGVSSMKELLKEAEENAVELVDNVRWEKDHYTKLLIKSIPIGKPKESK